MKAQLLETLLQHLYPSRILEVGCYVGYSAVRFGAAAQWRKGEVCSVEMATRFGIMDGFLVLGCRMWGNGGNQTVLKVENRSGVKWEFYHERVDSCCN